LAGFGRSTAPVAKMDAFLGDVEKAMGLRRRILDLTQRIGELEAHT